MISQASIILTYKGKILLFSRDVSLLTSEDNEWDFLKVGKLRGKSVADFLKKEINLPVKEKLDEIKVTEVKPQNNSKSRLFHMKLTDQSVNGIRRKSGWRLEFYRFSELRKISLSREAKEIATQYKNEIKDLLMI